jgi:hypothetical protein
VLTNVQAEDGDGDGDGDGDAEPAVLVVGSSPPHPADASSAVIAVTIINRFIPCMR